MVFTTACTTSPVPAMAATIAFIVSSIFPESFVFIFVFFCS
jgi:hypothetical protein